MSNSLAAPVSGKVSTVSGLGSEPKTMPRATKEHALNRIEGLLKSFPHARPEDEEVYGLNLAVVLLNFPRPIIDYVTAPGTGIQAQRGRRFPPTPGEVRQACEDALAMFEHAFEHATKPKRIEQAKAEIAAEAAERAARPSYEDLKAKYGPNWGVTTTEDLAGEERRVARERQQTVDRHNEIAREWDRRGVEAPRIGGIVVSPELAKQLSLKTNPKAEPKETTNDAA